jgi:hypothetical protein
MKKILLLVTILFVGGITYGQVDVGTLNDTEKKIVKTFKDVYVEKTFKDPYSFKLLKLDVVPKTFGDWQMDNIIFLKDFLQKKNFKYQSEKEAQESLARNEKEYSEMTDEIKKTIKAYKVRLDCYGNNSYGNPILGKYEFNYVVYSGLNLNEPVNYENERKLYVTELK